MQKVLLRKLVRFGITGIIVTGIHLLVVIAVIRFFSSNEMFANGLAFIIANIISFVINTLWSFSSKLEGKRLLKFLVVTFISFNLTLFIAWSAAFLGLHYITGVFIIICIVPMFTFLMHNYWTYK